MLVRVEIPMKKMKIKKRKGNAWVKLRKDLDSRGKRSEQSMKLAFVFCILLYSMGGKTMDLYCIDEKEVIKGVNTAEGFCSIYNYCILILCKMLCIFTAFVDHFMHEICTVKKKAFNLEVRNRLIDVTLFLIGKLVCFQANQFKNNN